MWLIMFAVTMSENHYLWSSIMVEGPLYHTLHGPKLITSTLHISHRDEFPGSIGPWMSSAGILKSTSPAATGPVGMRYHQQCTQKIMLQWVIRLPTRQHYELAIWLHNGNIYECHRIYKSSILSTLTNWQAIHLPWNICNSDDIIVKFKDRLKETKSFAENRTAKVWL